MTGSSLSNSEESSKAIRLIEQLAQERELLQLKFPHKPGSGQRSSDFDKALDALHVFAPIYKAVRAGELDPERIQDSFFKGLSDPITYRVSWKSGKFWSVAAWETFIADGSATKNGLVSEHVVPRGVALRYALAMPTLEGALRALWDLSFECVVTAEEDKRLTQAGLKSKGYPENPWQRYKEADIKILDVQHPRGSFFLTEGDREILGGLGILEPHAVVPCSCKHCVETQVA